MHKNILDNDTHKPLSLSKKRFKHPACSCNLTGVGTKLCYRTQTIEKKN